MSSEAPDRFLVNKMTILDRLTTLRAMAEHFAEGSYDGFDRVLFERLATNISASVETFTFEVKAREGRS
jgi:hypothetical protein